MSLLSDRLVRHPLVFREVNDRINEVAARMSVASGYVGGFTQFDFLCECSLSNCVQTVELRLDEYNAIRSSPKHFVMHAGHEDTENVIVKNDRFVVVEKTHDVDEVNASDPAPDEQRS